VLLLGGGLLADEGDAVRGVIETLPTTVVGSLGSNSCRNKFHSLCSSASPALTTADDELRTEGMLCGAVLIAGGRALGCKEDRELSTLPDSLCPESVESALTPCLLLVLVELLTLLLLGAAEPEGLPITEIALSLSFLDSACHSFH
jgi:hypothetical protein